MEELKKIRSGDIRQASRFMTDLENERPGIDAALAEIYRHTGRAYVIGITGSGGVGKSSLINSLIESCLKEGLDVGVIAIDPSSHLTGGALLGDRVRLQQREMGNRVFFRSIATRGWSGGLAGVALRILHVLDAMGKNVILVETAGTGQSDVNIAKVADTCALVLMPGMGDEIQAMNAGMLEIADIFVINKADILGAEETRKQLVEMLAMKNLPPNSWRPEIVLTEATKGKGVEELLEKIFRHKEFNISNGTFPMRRRERAKLEVAQIVGKYMRRIVTEIMNEKDIKERVEKVLERETDPYSIAMEVIERLHHPVPGKNLF